MDRVKLLRTLVITEIALTAGGVLSEFLLERYLPQQLQAYLKTESETPIGAREQLFLILGIPFGLAIILAWIGLLLFRKNAHKLYLVTCIGSIVLFLFAGPTVQTALGTALDAAVSLLGGLVLGLLYFTDLRNRYETTKPSVSHEGAA